MPATPSPRTPIGVGIIGLSASGGWAATAHLPALRALDGFEVRALSASSAASAKAAGEKYGIPLAFGTHEELVRRDEVDLVVITVKVPQHRELALAALHAGKMVLSEWPLGNGLAEAEELAALAESKGLRTFVGLQARSAPPVRYVRDLIASGYVGEVLSTSIIASGRGWGGDIPGRNAYTLDPANGATMLTVPFGHTIDALTMTLGEFTDLGATMATRRTSVRDEATGEILPMTAPDQLAVNGVLEGGAVASVHFRGGLSRATDFHWEINGTEGDLLLTGPSGHLQFGQVTVHGARGEETTLKELPVPTSYETLPQLTSRRTEMAYTIAHSYEQIHADLTNGTHHAPDFAHAVRRHRLLDRIERAATEG
ncbi:MULTISPECIES: Gfo/Idh/MocA family oxidoreductase [unclassified Streptomyces]|uniref:Gfo/Idh/MocA family protein n=1 Tax=unclassified Streptomyces TaxID=2593676 RepID=UPI0003643DA0|nr:MULTISPECIES: Gfo/Idh/MocA family oxidoreductase [unclassified Streptomyces]MYT29670.1 Gfo/Idh/MocA family oxidoreductase [Streptomyces sp. SID8354]